MAETINVFIHMDQYVDSGFGDSAADAIDFSMDPETNFDLDARVYGRGAFDAGTWEEVHDKFVNYLVDEGLEDRYNTSHVAIVNNLEMGAGQAWKRVNKGTNLRPYAGLCGVNAASKAYANKFCSGDGEKAFQNTVIQEVGHTLDAEHANGGMYTSSSVNEVSPMQTWYSAENCANNNPVDTNCTGNWWLAQAVIPASLHHVLPIVWRTM